MNSKLLLVLYFLLGSVCGGGAITTYMFLDSNSPLVVRENAYNETSSDLLELAKKYDALQAKYNELSATK